MLFYWTNVQHGKIIWPHYLKSQTLFTYNLVKLLFPSWPLPYEIYKYLFQIIKLLLSIFNICKYMTNNNNSWSTVNHIDRNLWAFVFVCVSHWIGALYPVSLILSKVWEGWNSGKCVSSQNHNSNWADSTLIYSEYG